MNQITIMKCLLNQGISDIYKQKKQSKQNNGWKESNEICFLVFGV